MHGFIKLQNEQVFDLIEHPYFQRLRRISQLGLTSLVYPGAIHTRFHHALGAMHLMGMAIDVIRQKGHDISEEEAQALMSAILLHDIGHGPFSHALEKSIIPEYNHEELSLLFMKKMNSDTGGILDYAIRIFCGDGTKKYLHQLVSSQLDMDRLDYLRRDSFFTGVSEGVIGTDRIIKMLEIQDEQLVIEHKGIYSIEKFLIARRLMYWQVYLHKTVLSAEKLLETVLMRAKDLSKAGARLPAPESFSFFLHKQGPVTDDMLDAFSMLDDSDIMSAVKDWTHYPDKILSHLSTNLMNRNLFKIVMSKERINDDFYEKLLHLTSKHFDISENEARYFVFRGTISNMAYNKEEDRIYILKSGKLVDIATASDMLDVTVLSYEVIKYYICYPKEIHASL